MVNVEEPALNIEVPTVTEKNTENFMAMLSDLDDDPSEERTEEAERSD